jgi:hypothetical protein
MDTNTLLARFPHFELSYEKMAHKKVSSHHSLALGIPRGRKYYAWYTFHMDRNVCYLLELNKDKRILRTSEVHAPFDPSLSLGTILYGTLVENHRSPEETVAATGAPFSIFMAEEIYYYRGLSLRDYTFSEKFTFLLEFLESQAPFAAAVAATNTPLPSLVCTLPIMWIDEASEATIPPDLAKNAGYAIHHIQYRDPTRISPYLNVMVQKHATTATPTSATQPQVASTPSLPEPPIARDLPFDYAKPQYRYPSVFRVTADLQYDVYHLYAYDDQTNAPVYLQPACVPNYKTSVFLNRIFRRIRENENLDWIEESDDEADFENTAMDKHVDLRKTVMMECTFHPKFKKWTPTRILGDSVKMVSLGKLVRAADDRPRQSFSRPAQGSHANRPRSHHPTHHANHHRR